MQMDNTVKYEVFVMHAILDISESYDILTSYVICNWTISVIKESKHGTFPPNFGTKIELKEIYNIFC